ncbi:uncharacterized protein LOC111406510 [Olea europaea var. sylvestris]|uniref:uncharacterized protein LOC111406510 n=1 Tax=Olea europaea var. sylvestris TaxID=158386 RepID=UPI000C1D8BAF|nr:uncharacterized protein LOC111406510 [Olea europaea var. sylvestris]
MVTKQPQPPSRTLISHLINLDTGISLHLYTLFFPKFLKFLALKFLSYPILPFSVIKFLKFSNNGSLFFPIILSLLFIGLLKHLIQHPRPIYCENMFFSFAVDHWSFPSGHSSRVSFIITLINFYLVSPEQILVARLKFDVDSILVEYFVVIVGYGLQLPQLRKYFWAIISCLMLLERVWVLVVWMGVGEKASVGHRLFYFNKGWVGDLIHIRSIDSPTLRASNTGMTLPISNRVAVGTSQIVLLLNLKLTSPSDQRVTHCCRHGDNAMAIGNGPNLFNSGEGGGISIGLDKGLGKNSGDPNSNIKIWGQICKSIQGPLYSS